MTQCDYIATAAFPEGHHLLVLVLPCRAIFESQVLGPISITLEKNVFKMFGHLSRLSIPLPCLL